MTRWTVWLRCDSVWVRCDAVWVCCDAVAGAGRQELPSAEEAQADGQLSVFCRRFRPSTYGLDELHEVTLPTATPAALLAALSSHSAVPADNIRLAKPPGSFPNDYNALLAPTELDWLRSVTGEQGGAVVEVPLRI